MSNRFCRFSSPFIPPYLEGARGVLAGVQRHDHVGPQQIAPCLHGRLFKADGLEARLDRGALVCDVVRIRGLHEKGVGGAVEGMLVRAGLHEQLSAVDGISRRQTKGDLERVIFAASHAATAFVGSGGDGDGVGGSRGWRLRGRG